MIIRDFHSPECQRGLPKVIIDVLNYLQAQDLHALPNGRNEINEQIYMNVFEPQLGTECEKKAELHHKYADIHVIIDGADRMQVQASTPDLSQFTPYDEKDDYQLCDNVENAVEFILKPQMFAVFLPFESHKTCLISDGNQGKIRKLVVKVPIELL